VIGVELSPLAVKAFFADNGLSTTKVQDKFSVSETESLRIYCGDFFGLTANDLTVVTAVYDRASLVAMPPEMRGAYTTQIQHLLEPGTTLLLVAFDYLQHEMQEPPFCVQDIEVKVVGVRLTYCALRTILDREAGFRDKGLSDMQEQIYTLNVL
jgi:thiopurine S-methyltransferase